MKKTLSLKVVLKTQPVDPRFKDYVFINGLWLKQSASCKIPDKKKQN